MYFSHRKKKIIFHTVEPKSVLKLEKRRVNKAAGIDNISGRFLKDADPSNTNLQFIY